MGGRLPALPAVGVCLALLLNSSGCCTVPPAGRYFDRTIPFDTISAFAYAIETRQWDFAYGCLTEESKKLITYTKFKLGLLFNQEVPEIKVPIRDLIIESDRKRYRVERETPRTAAMKLQYRRKDGNIWRPRIFLEREAEATALEAGREEPLWLIDLDRTLRGLGVQTVARGGEEAGRGQDPIK